MRVEFVWQKTKELLVKFRIWLMQHISFVLKNARPVLTKLCEYFLSNKETIFKVALPILIVLTGFYACTASQKTVNKNVNEIFLISDQIRSYYANKPDYWGLSTKSAIGQNLVEKAYISNGKILLSGGKEIFIGKGINADIVMPRSLSFDIVLPSLTKAQCIAMAEAKLEPENEVKLLAIQIINVAGEYTFEWGGKYKLPIPKYASKDLCIDGKNTLIWSLN